MAFGYKHRNYVAVVVTLAAANTVYNLYALINAIVLAETQGDNTIQAPGAARELTITAYNGIDGTGANTNDILFGDALLSTTRFGYSLSAGQTRDYRSPITNVPLQEIYVLSAGTAQKLAVEITVS